MTRDAFLGGAVMIEQPSVGYRSGMDAVLLAAGVPAVANDHILDAGAGVGVSSLCVAHRVPGTLITGIEIEPASVELAVRNIAANKMTERVRIIEGDIADPPRELLARSFDQVMFNPPYFDDIESFRPPPDAKRVGNVGSGATLHDWLDFGIKRLKPRGRLTLIHRTERLDDVLAIFRGRVADVLIHPFWPRRGEKAKRVLISGTKGSAGPPVLLAGIPLHAEGRRYSVEAEAVLRAGKSLDLN